MNEQPNSKEDGKGHSTRNGNYRSKSHTTCDSEVRSQESGRDEAGEGIGEGTQQRSKTLKKDRFKLSEDESKDDVSNKTCPEHEQPSSGSEPAPESKSLTDGKDPTEEKLPQKSSLPQKAKQPQEQVL